MDRIDDMVEEIDDDSEDIQVDVDVYDDFDEPSYNDFDRTINNDKASISKKPGGNNQYSCSKCNYTTHIKSRYTKHVKYHSMPMIKCFICEFRTPYKWNLDRHMKNHGGTGSFHCSMCNFTADIKQSLTVHEMNHHTPGMGPLNSNRRRNRVGASDIIVDERPRGSFTKEDEESGDSHSSQSDLGQHYADIEMVSCNSEDENDATSLDGGLHKTDAERKASAEQQSQSNSPRSNQESDDSKKNNKKGPRPIPQLIPILSSTPNQKSPEEPPKKKFKDNNASLNGHRKNKDIPPEISLIPINNATPKESGRKKNESFFDKLKVRLLAETGEDGALICKSCNFESKCLSEHSVHEKTCSVANRSATNTMMSSLSSTRCQYCRHRCKSSADLFHHMKTCKKDLTTSDVLPEAKSKNDNRTLDSTGMANDAEAPHPMENVVFVWNNINNAEKYDTPLDINIQDDCTEPDMNLSNDADLDNEHDGMNLSPSQAAGKKVLKCPHCSFWASTASRFHVHIVGHLNKKPFECSLCKYKSNWRWDITKHIKLKTARDPEHNEAKVLMTDETGRRNYSKYNKYFAVPVVNERGENVFRYVDQNASAEGLNFDDSLQDVNDQGYDLPLNLQIHYNEMDDKADYDKKIVKKSVWKCKKCNYRNPSREALFEHVREHHFNKKKDETPTNDPTDLAYRCGHCNQLSNWKHVIQRHCRLKHDGVINVVTIVKPKMDATLFFNDSSNEYTCNKCPFKTNDKKSILTHIQQHDPSPQSIFKCYFCPFFVKNESELMNHLVLHGVNDPEDYIAKAMGGKIPLPDKQILLHSSTSNKRHKCMDCPYETNSKSQYLYHEQFHKVSTETSYKCPECNYSVSKRHLLHQHLRVHGIISKRNDSDEAELESMSDKYDEGDSALLLDEIPYVWVSAKDEFHKMYKCHYCSYVNAQKCKIPVHEKVHFVSVENCIMIYKCLECTSSFDCASQLAEHSKTHCDIYGKIYCPVESDVPQEEQIAKLRKVIEEERACPTETTSQDDTVKEIKTMFFCKSCPARYFVESDLQIHGDDHNNLGLHKCKYCSFSAADESFIINHELVHSDGYHTKTKMLKFVHKVHPNYRQPRLELVHSAGPSQIIWVIYVNKRPIERKKETKQYSCKDCPARFAKSSTYLYHKGLHGGEGDFKCKRCSYAVNNVGNLARHEILHDNEKGYDSGDNDEDFKHVPLSGTDLFQRKTAAQKRVMSNKNKLVKPNDHFPPVLQADPQFGYLMHGNPEFIYPTYMKNGRQKEKRYKCHKCPSAFEKREQYKIHLSLHGSKQRYKCEVCDYSVKYYANYVQHMRKHQMNDEALAERVKGQGGLADVDLNGLVKFEKDNIKLAVKTMPKCTLKSDFQLFSITDQQTLRLLQRKRSINDCEKETNETSPTKDHKLHMCIHCPYTNQRHDALTNHYARHDQSSVLNVGNHKCSHCDLAVVQSHFLRDHMKLHFTYIKSLMPDCYTPNEGVTFTIQKEGEDKPTELILEPVDDCDMDCEKVYVNIKTGDFITD